VINPDAHRISGFQNLRFGVDSARKGWLTREDVVNTLSLKKIVEVLYPFQARDGKIEDKPQGLR
jgi:DNA polymerase (family 10)